MCGRCTRSVAGTSSLLGTVSESNMRINFPSEQVNFYKGLVMQLDYSHLQRYLLKKVTYETTFVLPKMMTPPQGVFEPNVFTVKRKIQPSIH